MINVDDDCVELVGSFRTEIHTVGGDLKEVAEDKLAALVGRYRLTERYKMTLVPVDHRCKRIDNAERPDAWVVEHGLRGVAQAEPTDDDVKRLVRRCRERKARDGFFAISDQARHQAVLADLDLEYVDLQCRFKPPAQADHANGCLLVIEFFEESAH